MDNQDNEFIRFAIEPSDSIDESEDIFNQVLSTFQLTKKTSYQSEIKSMIIQYLDAYIAKDWVTTKQFLSSNVITHFDQTIAEGYNLNSYKIIKIEKDDKASNAYAVYVKLYDYNQNLILRPDNTEEMIFLVEKENGLYKVITWYLSS